MSEHRISVIIPVHNGERYLEEALNSVFAQTYPVYECWVIDDGSTDNSAAIAQGFSGIKLFQQPNGNAARARNQGIRLSSGDLIAFLDADDLWLPDKLELQVKALEASPQADIVFGMIEQFYSPELPDELKARIYCTPIPVPGYLPSAFLSRATVFQQIGLLDPHQTTLEFVEWYSRVQDAGIQSLMLPQTVTRRRLHSLNQRAVRPEKPAQMVGMLKTVLDRRRSQANG